ncbi:sugar ABC transporter permease [Pseudoclavibacter endophyticus]|nr:ABC transporter permease [Pseudoclavibacter endophyticus]GGA64855.1 sugar ABC transporter permease [Pseudoclavibacter endophyticus]
MTTIDPNREAPADSGGAAPQKGAAVPRVAVTPTNRVLRALSFRNISAIYIFIALFIIFAILTPDTFLQPGVWRTLLDAQAITVLTACAVLLPLITGAFNLAIGAEVGLAGILVAMFMSSLGLPVPVAMLLTLAAGALVGAISGLIITKGKIDSFIATLGISSILTAAIAWFSGGQQILGLPTEFRIVSLSNVAGITTPVIIMLVVAFAIWYVTERTPLGRRMYASGFNKDAARLAGIDVARLQIGALVAGGVVAALAGILLSSRINAGDPTLGPSMLLPALSAVFLGSTQFRGGRFNVWGTVIAVYVLAVGVKGLQLMGAPGWINDLFNGVALLLAVGLSRMERTARRTGAIRRATTFGRGGREPRSTE